MTAPLHAPDTPRPIASLDASREALRATTEQLGVVVTKLTSALASAGAIYTTGTAVEKAAHERDVAALTAERGHLELAVQALVDQVERAEYAARLQEAASIDAQLQLGRERSLELVRDTARLVRQYDGKMLEVFEILAQIFDIEDEAVAISELFIAHGRGAELAAALPTPPGQTGYGARLHLLDLWNRFPRGVEDPTSGVRHHAFREWRRDERAAH
jgi:hypothetical protein